VQPEPVPEPEAAVNSGAGTLRFLVDIVETVLLSVILFLGINLISARVRVDGSSMDPTLQNGELVLVNKLAYKLGKPQQGDVIVFHPPIKPTEDYIKRIIGLPGDQVQVISGKVYINGKEIQEDYIAAAPIYSGSWHVPTDSFFVLGDNRNNSSDSHEWGFVPVENVIGKAIFVYWPPGQWALIQHIKIVSP